MKGKTQNLTLAVRLTPKASANAIKGPGADAAGNRFLKATVTAVPEKGKANKALIELLAREWDIPKSAITIVRGETDRQKMLMLRDISEQTAAFIRSLLS
jgi:uncharacterized protein